MNLSEIRGHITTLSGSGKRVVSTRRHGIYSSFTLPGLDDMLAVRDTKKRFEDFGVPKSLVGKTWLDIGANVGAMIFEAVRRGARVTGLEYRDDRVWLMQSIARFYAEAKNDEGELALPFMKDATFLQDDLNDKKWDTDLRPHDIVLCSSVDEYIEDRELFYSSIRALTKEVCYFESNIQRDVDEFDTIAALKDAGFKTIDYLGNGDSGGISRKRKLYRAVHT